MGGGERGEGDASKYKNINYCQGEKGINDIEEKIWASVRQGIEV